MVIASGGGDEDAGAREPAADPDGLAERLMARHPRGRIELALLRRSGGALADVLRGRAEALELLFGGTPSAADLYRESPAARVAHAAAAAAIAEAVSGSPGGRRLRVLEAGAGTGGVTQAVLRALPEDRTDYVFTDVSAGFFAEAEERFASSPARFAYRVLDIERDPAEQGFHDHSADLLLAANVLLATRDLGDSLAHCQRLLAPSGLLVVLEATARRGWLDLTFGLLPEWWRFDDAYRTDHALVGPAVWRRALGEAGYTDVEIGEPGSGGAGEGAGRAAVIVARTPRTCAPAGPWSSGRRRGPPGPPARRSRDESAALARALPGEGSGVTARGSSRSQPAGVARSLRGPLPAGAPLPGGGDLGAVSDSSPGAVKSTGPDAEQLAASALALAARGPGCRGRGPPAAGVWFVPAAGRCSTGSGAAGSRGRRCGGSPAPPPSS